jgi:DNA-binding transcriptional ArsR family regulator
VAAKNQVEEAQLGDELVLVISSEITEKVLVVLVERAASPKEIADQLDLKIPTASPHVKKLKRIGLVELIEEKIVGGAVQHIYRAVVRPIMSTEEWAKLSVAERQRYSIWIVRMILADAAKSFQANVFDARPNTHLSRTPIIVDETGLGEVANIQTRALNEIIQAEATSAERMVQSGEQGMNIIAAMMCFELPEPSEGLSRSETAQGGG